MKRNISISFTDLLFWVSVHYFKNFLEKCSHDLLLKIYQQFSLYKIYGVIWILKEKEIVATNLIFLMNILVTTWFLCINWPKFFPDMFVYKKVEEVDEHFDPRAPANEGNFYNEFLHYGKK